MTAGLPVTTQLGVFHNDEELASWLTYQNDSSIYAYDYIKLICNPDFIYTNFTNEVLTRYALFKNYNVYSYSNKFEELPARWIDMLGILDSEYNKAMEVWKRLQTQKSG